jgi:predicted Na+-dependent transporter
MASPYQHRNVRHVQTGIVFMVVTVFMVVVDCVHGSSCLVHMIILCVCVVILCVLRAGLWVGRAVPLPWALTSRGRQKGGHRPATR